jgi:shikimate dehydrogenase
VEHSRSPLIHRYWLQHYGIAGSYSRRAVARAELPGFFEELRRGAYLGANVTTPHKSAALSLSDHADAAARAIGAANTLIVHRGRVEARNTDAPGFLASLDQAAPRWDRTCRRALILGAGGAARAVIWALLSRKVSRIALANRTAIHADVLGARFGSAVEPVSWAARGEAVDDVDLLVNTTSLGMTGGPALELDVARLPARAVVADLVYVPLRTELLIAAGARGLTTVGGVGMLLHQAVPGFEAWFGKRPAVTRKLYDLVAADIGAEDGRAA